jgi:CheY-like chemotaxis protein
MKRLARRRVLIVDDNAHARVFLAQILGAVDIEVMQAASGPEALVLLNTIRVDAVFVDMFMLPMDGIALTRAIRASDTAEIAQLPVIMASAQASREVVRGGAEAGVTGFVAKPFTPAAVLTRLSGALSPRAATARPTAAAPSAPKSPPPEDPDQQAMAYL